MSAAEADPLGVLGPGPTTPPETETPAGATPSSPTYSEATGAFSWDGFNPVPAADFPPPPPRRVSLPMPPTELAPAAVAEPPSPPGAAAALSTAALQEAYEAAEACRDRPTIADAVAAADGDEQSSQQLLRELVTSQQRELAALQQVRASSRRGALDTHASMSCSYP